MNHQAALEKVQDVLSRLRIDPPEVSNVTLTPSQADLGWCPRKLYYKLTSEAGKNRTNLTDRLRKDIGNAIHDTVQGWLKEELPEVVVEFPTRDIDMDGVIAHGRLDLIIGDLYDGYDYLGEVKSCKGTDFKTYLQTIPPSYKFQILMNAALLDHWLPAIFILVNRNNMQYAARLVEVSKAEWEHEYAKLLKFRQTQVDGKIIPAIPANRSSFLCGHLVPCRYYESCFGNKQTPAIGKTAIFGRRS